MAKLNGIEGGEYRAWAPEAERNALPSAPWSELALWIFLLFGFKPGLYGHPAWCPQASDSSRSPAASCWSCGLFLDSKPEHPVLCVCLQLKEHMFCFVSLLPLGCLANLPTLLGLNLTTSRELRGVRGLCVQPQILTVGKRIQQTVCWVLLTCPWLTTLENLVELD